MKKTIGIITIIIGYLMSCYSILFITANDLKKASIHFNRQIEVLGIGLLVLGAILFTIGLLLIVYKSKLEKQ
ncbi:hypothetical protein WNY78_13285 [Psychroserpens sp. AS72]|uniref:hypothetical protein n=1 Tax=Psychroserpens sp. AS72 TaxID=3135775 RepID=UPI00316EB376